MKVALLCKVSRFLSLIISLFLLFSSCKKNDSYGVYENKGDIGSSGGMIKTKDGASVEIPAGAMKSENLVSVTNETLTNNQVNNAYQVYNIKPDGLTFNDSVVITLPFDDSYIDPNNKDGNYGVAIYYNNGTFWEELKTQVDLETKTARVKSLHFSKYFIEYPSSWSDYFFKNSSKAGVRLNVPYSLGEGNMGAYYSLWMVTKYAGYAYTAQYFANSMGANSSDQGFNLNKLVVLENMLFSLGIQTSISSPPWLNKHNLSGYLIGQLDAGFPVWVESEAIGNIFVVTGYDPTGFFIHDPSGDFIKKIEDIHTYSLSQYCNYHVSYENFKSILSHNPGNPDFGIPNYTLVIKTNGGLESFGLTMNFISRSENAFITEYGNRKIGELQGYNFVLPNTDQFVAFSNLDSIFLRPVISNSNPLTNVVAKLHYKIDGQEVDSSPISIEVNKSDAHFLPGKVGISFNKLGLGSHTANISLRSDDDQVLYDSWDLRFYLDNNIAVEGTIKDIDNNTYYTVKIGDQIWTVENLQTSKFNDGESIPLATDNAAWAGLNAPGFCWGLYGGFYNWYAANSGKLCPVGWHVPSDEEWTTLENYLGGTNSAGLKLKEAGSAHWASAYSANNSSGFTALPGGWRSYDGAYYMGDGTLGRWWSSTISYSRTLLDFSEIIYRDWMGQTGGFSVRCLKDN